MDEVFCIYYFVIDIMLLLILCLEEEGKLMCKMKICSLELFL